MYADTAPPVVEQVRFKSDGGNLEIWIEVSEEIDETALQQQMRSGALRLTDLDEDVDLAISVSQPVVTGRQARRRLVITTTDPPAEAQETRHARPRSGRKSDPSQGTFR